MIGPVAGGGPRTSDVPTAVGRRDATESASAESGARQIQMIEERHSDSGSKRVTAATDTESLLWLGASASCGGRGVCFAVQEWISEQLRRAAAALKERRKASEDRNLNQAPNGGAKGGNNG